MKLLALVINQAYTSFAEYKTEILLKKPYIISVGLAISRKALKRIV